MNVLWQGLLDLLFPQIPVCLLCGRDLAAYERQQQLCVDCRQRLVRQSPFVCAKCGKPMPRPGYLCLDCAVVRHTFERARAVGIYEGLMQECIQQLKFYGKKELAQPLAELMANKLIGEGLPPLDLIVPVPLHPSKEKARGYNQSAVLAEVVGERLQIPYLRDGLVRTRATESQSRMGRVQRLTNLHGAFAVPDQPAIVDRKILLVDDVYTTGATVDECAKVLLDAGASMVEVIVLAAGR